MLEVPRKWLSSTKLTIFPSSRHLQGKRGSDHSPARATVQSQAFMCASAGLHAHCSDSIQRATANWMERKPELVFNEKEKHEQWRMNGPLSMSAGFSARDSKEVVFEHHSAASTYFKEQEEQTSNREQTMWRETFCSRGLGLIRALRV